MTAKHQPIPRFVVTIMDFKTREQLAAGSDRLTDFTKPLLAKDRKYGERTELERMFKFFKAKIRALEKGEIKQEERE